MAAASNTTGTPLPLHYGYVWITGQKIGGTTLQNTGNAALDWTRVAGYLMGAGEMDGCEWLYDTGVGRLLFTSEFDNPDQFHFHRGCDAVIGSGLVPNINQTNTTTDQTVDSFIQYLPSGIQPLTYNRMAHYWLKIKLGVNNPPNTNVDDPNNFTDLNPIGMWRGLRVRLFDATGAMTGYGFSTTPTWCMLDLILRRKLFVEYALDPVNGADDLPQAVRNRIDWGAMAAHAAACNVINPNTGHRMFEMGISITGQGTLQSVMSPMLQSCRSFFQERNGLLSFILDQPRASVFTLSRRNTRTFTADDKDLHAASNRVLGQYFDTEIPACATIAGISFPDHQNPVVTTLASHPCAQGDYIIIGGTGTTYDTQWVVKSVPAVDASGNVYQMTLATRGTNYPATVGAGGKIGLVYSRFKQRTPEFNHKRNQYTKGAVGIGIPRQRNKVSLTVSFGNNNWDQVSRVSNYELLRALGPDTIPYVTPVVGSATLDLFAPDAAGSGAVACGIDPGDVVTVDSTLSATMPGVFEVIDTDFQPDTPASSGGQPGAGTMTLKLGAYSAGNYPSTSTSSLTAAGWETVPGSAPGNQSNYTEIPLENGSAYFFSGGCAGGQVVQLPALGISPRNFMGWVSPEGHIDGSEHLHYIQICDIDANRKTSMIYSSDVGVTWTGDVGFAGLCWTSNASVTQTMVNSITFVELTLAGGEKCIFGRGLVPDGTNVQMPGGYTPQQAFMLAMMRDGQNTDHPAHGCRAYVDANGFAHMDYQDGENNQWHGNCVVLVFAWLNNGSSWTVENGWARCPLARVSARIAQPTSAHMTFAVGGFSILDAGLNNQEPPNFPAAYLSVLNGQLVLPPDFAQTTLQTISGVNSFQITGNDAHGVAACYIDGNLNSSASFEDGEGNVWYGSAGVLGLLCDQTTGTYNPPRGGPAPRITPTPPGSGSSTAPGDTGTNAVLTADCSLTGNGYELDAVDVEDGGSGYTGSSAAVATDGTTSVVLSLTLAGNGVITAAIPVTANVIFANPPTVSVTR